ncbi:MAG: T9SS type A sorting domain-containing protein, partial [Calditrichaeota bacterium]|nr:T9SS type A sorting domain-containing protein [Calditrichota bacterium]
MKTLRFILFLAFLSQLTYAQQDPREFSHSMSILPFTDSTGLQYYITWSSSSGSDDGEWQHDIYKQIVSFDETAVLQTESGPVRYIGSGSDEAQEPVSVALNPDENIIMSVWEDGSGATVDIRGQMHKPNGSVIKKNWILAGGTESQHSPSVVHVGKSFLVAYTDEAPPAEFAMNKAKMLDDQTGAFLQTLELSPRDEDQWWPVAASDNKKHAFVGWGDGSNFSGTVVSLSSETASKTSPQSYLHHINQYYYSVAWLEKLSRFIAIAKSGMNSYVCLIDTSGARKSYAIIENTPITRETKLAVTWDEVSQQYIVLYPTGLRDVALINVSNSAVGLAQIINGGQHPVLNNISWPTTGIACQFVESTSGRDLWQDKKLVLVAFNDENSNDTVLLTVERDKQTAVGAEKSDSIPKGIKLFPAYPNPFNSSTGIRFSISLPALVEMKIYSVSGQFVRTLAKNRFSAGQHFVAWDGKNSAGNDVSSGQYICKFIMNGEIRYQ